MSGIGTHQGQRLSVLPHTASTATFGEHSLRKSAPLVMSLLQSELQHTMQCLQPTMHVHVHNPEDSLSVESAYEAAQLRSAHHKHRSLQALSFHGLGSEPVNAVEYVFVSMSIQVIAQAMGATRLFVVKCDKATRSST